MLAGFLDIYREYHSIPLVCPIRWDHSPPLSKRFPEIQWIRSTPGARPRFIHESLFWLGVGGSPFQVSDGPWFLERIRGDLEVIAQAEKPMYMLGVGAEAECLERRDDVLRILENIDHIWTRDRCTSDLLKDLYGLGSERVEEGSDLANISLSRIFADSGAHDADRVHNLAIGYSASSLCHANALDIMRFTDYVRRDGDVVFFGNETRKHKNYEYGIYKSIYGGLRGVIKKPSVRLFLPDYKGSTLEGLVRHYATYRVVMSSRYHALLCAAWAGCRVAGLGDGSKLRSLSEQLDIPVVTRPLTTERLMHGYENAKSVARPILEAMARKTRESVRELCSLASFPGY